MATNVGQDMLLKPAKGVSEFVLVSKFYVNV